MKHFLVEGCTDESWIVFSLHLASFLDASPLISQLPPGNVNRVFEEKLGGGLIVAESKIRSKDHLSTDSLFFRKEQSATFFVPSMFTMTGRRARNLHIVELLAIMNYPVLMVQLLSTIYQKLLWQRSETPSRVLVLVLRSFLACNKSTEGVKEEIKSGVEDGLVTVESKSGSMSIDTVEDKLDNVIDGRLGKKSMLNNPDFSLIPSLLPTITHKSPSTDKKCDNASVPTEYWLYW